MMLRALARRSSTGSLTVLGDLAQATTPWATRSWAEALGHLGKPDAHVEQLTRGFRVPGEVIEYAARLLPIIAPGLEPPTSVRRTRGELEIVAAASAVPHISAALDREGSIGVIAPDDLIDALGASLGCRRRPLRRGRAGVRPRRPRTTSRPSSTSTSTWSRRPSPRAWSSTTSSSSSRRRSWPPSPTGSPGCAGCTSA